MRLRSGLASAAGAWVLLSMAPDATAQAQAPRTPAPIVFFDIAGPDNASQTAFYDKVFGWRSGPGGVLSIPVASPKLAGSLRADPAQKIIYIGVDDVKATLAAISANGGKIVRPRFEVRGVVVLGLFTDPAGNAMGLVELAADGKPKIP